MAGGNKIMVIAGVIIVALILQIVLIGAGAGRHETPGAAAAAFSKAYFKLDADMAELLCSEITEDEDADVVGAYLHRVAAEARAEGFAPSWKRMALAHIDLQTEMVDENTANVHISSERRRSINPVFAAVAKIFRLGDTYDVDDTLTVVREDDNWKVCGQPFALIES